MEALPGRLHDLFALADQCKKNDCTMGLQRPLDWAETTARLSRNDRTIEPQRPVNAKATTARCCKPSGRAWEYRGKAVPLSEMKTI